MIHFRFILSTVSRAIIHRNSSREYGRHFVLKRTTQLNHVKCATKSPPKYQQRCRSLVSGSILRFTSAKISSPRLFISGTKLPIPTTQEAKLVVMENSQPGSEGMVDEFRKSKKLLRRPLGGIESVYHYTSSKGSDIVWLMLKVNSVFPVNEEMVEKSLYFLAEKHPLLRMTIQCQADDIYFLETDELKLDFSLSNRTDWLQLISDEVAVPFDISNGPIWKCILLKTEEQDEVDQEQENQSDVSGDLVHESTVLFVLHHSVMDGSYSMEFIGQFVDALNRISLDTLSSAAKHNTLLLPPIDDMLLCPTEHRTAASSDDSDITSSFSINTSFTDTPTKALDIYNRKFHAEIQELWSEQPRTRFLPFEFTRTDTTQFLRSCKDTEVSPIGVFVAAAVQGFVDLVGPSLSTHNFIPIPFDLMVDLRRFCPPHISANVTDCSPGVASVPVPMIADMVITQRPVSNGQIWKMSKAYGKYILNAVNSPETFSQTLNMIRACA